MQLNLSIDFLLKSRINFELKEFFLDYKIYSLLHEKLVNNLTGILLEGKEFMMEFL